MLALSGYGRANRDRSCNHDYRAGDDKQLPPTPFFQVAELDELAPDEEDANIEEDMESVLDACAALLPVQSLKWHYRSRRGGSGVPHLVARRGAEDGSVRATIQSQHQGKYSGELAHRECSHKRQRIHAADVRLAIRHIHRPPK